MKILKNLFSHKKVFAINWKFLSKLKNQQASAFVRSILKKYFYIYKIIIKKTM